MPVSSKQYYVLPLTSTDIYMSMEQLSWIDRHQHSTVPVLVLVLWQLPELLFVVLYMDVRCTRIADAQIVHIHNTFYYSYAELFRLVIRLGYSVFETRETCCFHPLSLSNLFSAIVFLQLPALVLVAADAIVYSADLQNSVAHTMGSSSMALAARLAVLVLSMLNYNRQSYLRSLI